jgi:methylmalonyl-CoA/ethylmalonyl-CoA epimerase
MLRKIEHLGIAVNSIKDSLLIYEKLLGQSCYKTEIVESEYVKTAFIQIGESKIELLEATDPSSPIAKFLEKKGQGFHHVAFDVQNIEEEIDRLKREGFELIHLSPKQGADQKMIAFLHPKSTEGLLIEICQDIIHK